jgi:uncharacterized protein YndB with AHSA1/START domain
MTGTGSIRLEMRRVLGAPSAVVFRALSDPLELAKYWGPEGFTIPSVESELRVGPSPTPSAGNLPTSMIARPW